jgi:hypothetical protein
MLKQEWRGKMPGNLTDTEHSDFDIALQDLEFMCHKARLIHEIELKERALPLSPRLQRIKIEQEVLILREKIKDLESERIKRTG